MKMDMMKMVLLRKLATLAVVLAMSACTTSGTPAVPASPAIAKVAPEQRLANVVAASKGADDRELAVQPLRDPQVQDLREDAVAAIAARDYPAAAEALNQALLIAPDDPAILQERAEVALLQAENERAETLAKRAFDLGSKVGPLCRRHWATIEQARLARDLQQDAASAHTQIEACTVAGLNRM
jgi:tetratricopeptide (TPR) repeat protein